MDSESCMHLHFKHTTMTNSDIMRASLLDIVFENRNKDYGAYELRHSYNKRLLLALGAGVTIIALLIAGVRMGSKENTSTVSRDKGGMVIKEYVLPPEKPKEPEKPKVPEKKQPVAKVKPAAPVVSKVAEIKYTTPVIKETVKTPMPPVENIGEAVISDKTKAGEKDNGKAVVTPEGPRESNGNGNGGPSVPEQEFVVQEKEPEFPGGQAALQRFLARYLTTPEELSSGEMKVVKVRFKVEKDGSVNGFEILTSGGNSFDNEVLRVVKKMPRWIPAIQNGINVPVSYVLPVTFIGLEG